MVYSHLQRSEAGVIVDEAGNRKRKKVRMFPLVAPAGKHLHAIAQGSGLLEYSKPAKIESEGDKERVVWVVPSLMGRKGALGWPLPAVRVRQKKERDGWSTVGEC